MKPNTTATRETVLKYLLTKGLDLNIIESDTNNPPLYARYGKPLMRHYYTNSVISFVDSIGAESKPTELLTVTDIVKSQYLDKTITFKESHSGLLMTGKVTEVDTPDDGYGGGGYFVYLHINVNGNIYQHELNP